MLVNRFVITALVAVALGITSQAQSLKIGRFKNVTRITDDAGVRYENPRWSPDGKHIAFTRFGYDGLYVINPDGKQKRQLSDGAGVGYMYQWSADSKEILMRDTRWELNADGYRRLHALWSVDLNGALTRQTLDSDEMQPGAWRYSATTGRTVVCPDAVVVQQAKSAQSLSKAELSAITTPGFTTSCITDCENLYIVNAIGSKRLIYEGVALMPAISPDGTKVAFCNQYDEIMVINIDGTGLTKVTKGFSPAWASESQLVYERTTDDGHNYMSGNLFIININGNGERRLTNNPARIDMNASVSPDGKRVAFTDFASGQVYVADLK